MFSLNFLAAPTVSLNFSSTQHAEKSINIPYYRNSSVKGEEHIEIIVQAWYIQSHLINFANEISLPFPSPIGKAYVGSKCVLAKTTPRKSLEGGHKLESTPPSPSISEWIWYNRSWNSERENMGRVLTRNFNSRGRRKSPCRFQVYLESNMEIYGKTWRIRKENGCSWE